MKRESRTWSWMLALLGACGSDAAPARVDDAGVVEVDASEAGAAGASAIDAGKADDGDAAKPYSLPELPSSLPPMSVPEDNPTTVEGAFLGRVLYYDKRLSPDGKRACASCHDQKRAFSSGGGVAVLPHMNLAWSRFFLWSGSTEGTLEDAMHMEVEEFFKTDLSRLREPDLEALFEAAFGTKEITTERVVYALAQFQRTLVSGRSRYDAYVAGDASALSDAERRGMKLFYSERAECFHCHVAPLFTDNGFHNTGLTAEILSTGRGAYSGRSIDDGKWKTPTLRNIAQTAPYMHDDRFATLEEVVDFYSEGPEASATLDSLVPVGGFRLTREERADLAAFLKALTDDSFLADPRLGPPR